MSGWLEESSYFGTQSFCVLQFGLSDELWDGVDGRVHGNRCGLPLIVFWMVCPVSVLAVRGWPGSRLPSVPFAFGCAAQFQSPEDEYTQAR
jgi:hypothetical protein